MGEQHYSRALKALRVALKRRRHELGLTQEDVAEAMGIVVRQYQKIEAGEMNVTLRTLTRLATVLRLPLRDFF